jgi:hypothetical protein
MGISESEVCHLMILLRFQYRMELYDGTMRVTEAQ